MSNDNTVTTKKGAQAQTTSVPNLGTNNQITP